MAARDQYYITDTSGKFYRLGSKGALVIAQNTNEAQIFSFEEARRKIGKGKKAHFYKTVPVDNVPASENQESANASSGERASTETTASHDTGKDHSPDHGTSTVNPLFGDITDLARVDWIELLENLAYVGTMLPAYKDQLREDQSRNDLLITDLLHLIELYQTGDEETEPIMEKLRQAREERRIIKNEFFRAEKFQAAIGTKAIVGNAKEALRQIRAKEGGNYHPRTAPQLFDGREQRSRVLHKYYAEKEDIVYGSVEIPETEGAEDWEEEEMEQDYRDYERVGTVYDREKPDWRQLVQLQIDFFRNARTYIRDLEYDIAALDEQVEDALGRLEESNYNAPQGARAFRELKELRLAKKEAANDLYAVRAIADRFDCGYMLEAYEDIQEDIGVFDEPAGSGAEIDATADMEEGADAEGSRSAYIS